MSKFDEVYHNITKLLNEAADPAEDKLHGHQKLKDYSVSWKYHDKENKFDHGSIDKLSYDRLFNMKGFDSLEDFVNVRFPEKVREGSGYYYVEVKDSDGNVVYRRGDEMGVGL